MLRLQVIHPPKDSCGAFLLVLMFNNFWHSPLLIVLYCMGPTRESQIDFSVFPDPENVIVLEYNFKLLTNT